MKLITRNSRTPIYQQISDFMRDEISSGKMSPGAQVWSEHEIMEKFKVSRNSAQKAIEVLVNKGLVVRVQGKGTFTTDGRVSYGLHILTSFSEESLIKGLKPTSRLISFEKQNGDSFTAQQLGLEQFASVYRLERVRLADQQPISHQISFVTVKLCPDLEQFNFETESLYQVLENYYNYTLAWQKIIIKPIIAGHKLADWLNISSTTPLLQTVSVAYLENGTPIEFSQNTYRSDRYEFSVQSFRRRAQSQWRGIKRL